MNEGHLYFYMYAAGLYFSVSQANLLKFLGLTYFEERLFITDETS